MATEIWSANIIVGTDTNQVIFEKVPCKRLPTHILTTMPDFIDRLKMGMTDKKWKELLKKGETTPKIKVIFLKQVGIVNQEPEILI